MKLWQDLNSLIFIKPFKKLVLFKVELQFKNWILSITNILNLSKNPDFSRESIWIFLRITPKLMNFIFGPFFVSRSCHVFFLEIFEMLHCSYFQKWIGNSRKKHVINLKTGKRPKMNMLDFGAFQRKIKMPSHDKYLLDILFGHSMVPVYISLKLFTWVNWLKIVAW